MDVEVTIDYFKVLGGLKVSKKKSFRTDVTKHLPNKSQMEIPWKLLQKTIHSLPQKDWILCKLRSPRHWCEYHWVNGQNDAHWKEARMDSWCCNRTCSCIYDTCNNIHWEAKHIVWQEYFWQTYRSCLFEDCVLLTCTSLAQYNGTLM